VDGPQRDSGERPSPIDALEGMALTPTEMTDTHEAAEQQSETAHTHEHHHDHEHEHEHGLLMMRLKLMICVRAACCCLLLRGDTVGRDYSSAMNGYL